MHLKAWQDAIGSWDRAVTLRRQSRAMCDRQSLRPLAGTCSTPITSIGDGQLSTALSPLPLWSPRLPAFRHPRITFVVAYCGFGAHQLETSWCRGIFVMWMRETVWFRLANRTRPNRVSARNHDRHAKTAGRSW